MFITIVKEVVIDIYVHRFRTSNNLDPLPVDSKYYDQREEDPNI